MFAGVTSLSEETKFTLCFSPEIKTNGMSVTTGTCTYIYVRNRFSSYMIFTGITGGHVLRSTDSTVTTTSVGSAGQLYLQELIPLMYV